MDIDTRSLVGSEAYRLLVCSVLPRPIAFVTSTNPDGTTNLAPFSYFNVVASRPPLVSIAIGQRTWEGRKQKKDTLKNIEASGQFVVNVATERLLSVVNESSADFAPGVSELDQLGLSTLDSKVVEVPSLAESPVNMECKLHRVIMLGDEPQVGLVIGEVVHYHAKDEVWDDEAGGPDPRRLDPLARLGGTYYASLGALHSIERPPRP
jgi:flavin reductase (DIM6/NTAB) family NADH-FMN oxidoreductase RutF